MTQSRLRIGYFANSSNFEATGDRRRVAYWAKNRKHSLVFNKSQDVDLVILTGGGFFPKLKCLERVPVVLDLPDSYAIKDRSAYDYFRMGVRYLKGKVPLTPHSFSEFINMLIQRADLVITSSIEQSDLISDARKIYNILDFHEEFPQIERSLLPKVPFQFFWEGQTHSLKQLTEFKNISKTQDGSVGGLFILTDPVHSLISNGVPRVPTKLAFPRLFLRNTSGIKFLPWSMKNIEFASQISDICFLPINKRNPISFLKPENRILISWRLGLPVIASSTPSHDRLQKSIDVNFTYRSSDELKNLIYIYSRTPELLVKQVSLGKNYLSVKHTKDILLSKWDQAIASIL